MSRVLVLVLVGVACLAAVSSAGAATARSGNLQQLYKGDDGFRNYDFNSQTVASNNVDWAVSLLFYNNATINKVKNSAIGPLYDQTGSAQYGRLSENVSSGFVWDTDSGRKTTKCPGAPLQPSMARHYRIYADGDDRLYNLNWGYWVYGTTHWDMYECSLTTAASFGYSENAEEWIVYDWTTRTGWSATRNWGSMANPEPFRVSGDHIWDGDGNASLFLVP